MRYRAADENGDILPAVKPGGLLTGAEALGASLRDWLALRRGAWWEDPSAGSPLTELAAGERLTAADTGRLASAMTAYLLSHPAVTGVRGIRVTVTGRAMTLDCTAEGEDGAVAVSTELNT